MKDGRIVVETLKLSGVARHQNLLEPGMPRAIYGSGSQSPWLAKEYEPTPASCRPGPSPAPCRARTDVPPPEEEEVSRDKATKALYVPVPSAKKAVPTLRKKTLKVSGRVPRVLPVKLGAEGKRGDEEQHIMEDQVQAQPVAMPDPLPIPDSLPQFEPLEVAPVVDAPVELPAFDLPSMELPVAELPSVEIPAHVQVKFIPTPKKRGPRSLSAEDETTAPPITKPLKVIRKRREQAPKVFETAPKPVPQAMLEGIKKPQENGEQPD